jgi:hypothetical protein
LEEGEVRDKTLNKTPLASKKTYKAKGVFLSAPPLKKNHIFFKNTSVTEVVKNRL